MYLCMKLRPGLRLKTSVMYVRITGFEGMFALFGSTDVIGIRLLYIDERRIRLVVEGG